VHFCFRAFEVALAFSNTCGFSVCRLCVTDEPALMSKQRSIAKKKYFPLVSQSIKFFVLLADIGCNY